jgi:7-cyano-7-deazaguanine synthase
MAITQTRRAIVLLSGGLDSATVLAAARSEGIECWGLSFDYGQRHRHELAAAGILARAMNVARHVVMPLDLRVFGGSALTADVPVPKDRKEKEMESGIPITYVPARNLMFLSIAAGLAEVAQAREIHIGVNAVDYSGYPDCRPAFIESFERTVNLGTKAGVEGQMLKVVAPLVTMSKAQIIRFGADLGVDYALTHSCYDPVTRQDGAVLACRRCDSCLIRAKGFHDAGVMDPTRYV